MSIYRFAIPAVLISAWAEAGTMTASAPRIAAEAMEPKYSEATQKATQAFLIQSKVGAQLDAMEIYVAKKIVSKTKNSLGDSGSAVVAASVFLARCIRDKKVITKVSNPLIGQSHLLSVGVDGLEISGIKSTIGSSHWIRFSNNEKEGNRYATGINFTF